MAEQPGTVAEHMGTVVEYLERVACAPGMVAELLLAVAEPAEAGAATGWWCQ